MKMHSARDRGPGYLVVVDASEESESALRYAVRRAAAMGGHITLLYIIPPAEFVQWGGVQDMIAAEALEDAESALVRAADKVQQLSGIMPSLVVSKGKVVDEVVSVIEADETLSAIVLGAATKGSPGPLVTHFSGERAGALPLVVIIVPGALGAEAIDLLTGDAPDMESDDHAHTPPPAAPL